MTAKILQLRDYPPKFKEKPLHGTSAQIVYFRDYQSKKDLARMYGETMEQQAIGIVDYINGLTGHPEMVPYHGSGIDGMYVAPDKDPA